MYKVGLCGCTGAMGLALSHLLTNDKTMTISFGITLNPITTMYPMYTTFSDVLETCDVLIDFSNPSLTLDLLEYATMRKIPIVLATTNLTAKHEQKILEASRIIPILNSSNTSHGINVVIELIKQATKLLQHSADIEIIESHHRQKEDVPSGTAKMIAEAIVKSSSTDACVLYGRNEEDEKKKREEINIHAIRGGTIFGEHEVIFACEDEVIKIKHIALSKKIFAKNAVDIAKKLIKKQPGLYTMSDYLNWVE